jgi:hypothetical protein
MGMIAETAIVDYRLTTKEKQTSGFHFLCSKQLEVCGFLFSVCSKQKFTFSIISVSIYICCLFKREMEHGRSGDFPSSIYR